MQKVKLEDMGEFNDNILHNDHNHFSENAVNW